jgi:putative transposase
MPRQPRFELVDVAQHVVQRGNNRQPTFFCDGDYRVYLETLCEAALRHCCDIHAYVLMTNHVHLLVTPRAPMAIARLMQAVGRRYVYYVNHAYGRTGTLWEGRYKASLVGTPDYVLTCYRYIEMNPVRAGMVSDPREYRWSSHGRNAWLAPDTLLSDHPDFAALGPDAPARALAYRQRIAEEPGSDVLRDIRDSANQCRAFAPECFKDEIETALRRRVRAGRPGRKPREPEIAV